MPGIVLRSGALIAATMAIFAVPSAGVAATNRPEIEATVRGGEVAQANGGSQSQAGPSLGEMAQARRFTAAKFSRPRPEAHRNPGLVVAQNNGPLESNNHRGKPLRIGEHEFTRGLACHADSKIIVRLPAPGKILTSYIGLDDNEQTHTGQGSVTFGVRVGGRRLFRSGVYGVGTEAGLAEVELHGAEELVLEVGDAGDGIGWDQADWTDARVEMLDGSVIWLGDMPVLEVQDALFSTEPPFSFTYHGDSSSEFLESWTVDHTPHPLDAHRTAYSVSYSDPASGLVVRCEAVAYDDFPTVEWTLYFKNSGSTDTPIIENIRSLDVRWQRSREHEYLLHHNIGSPADGTDYSPLESTLGGGTTTRCGAVGGRSTAATMSYFNLERSPDDGLIVVVGWPGQWAAEFERDRDLGVRIAAGQELTHFVLHPGEEVRTPLSVLQFWNGGDWIRAQNIWRRWMISHNVPKPDGNLPSPMLLAYSGGAYEEMYKATEATQFMWFDRYLEENIRLDCWWMDAGWYPCDPVGWPKVGTWEVDKRRFPRGLRAITDHAHSKGVKTLLWFEPERVAPGTYLAENKPQWVLGGEHGGILNLGDPEARAWITDRVDSVLSGEGIDLYRQDFNINPLGYWRAADAQDRQGITEIQHVTGLLAYWDELRQRHPNMLIDECASGGRRNDLEMMRRAVPMWRSDKTMEPCGQQSMTYGISMWIPYFGTGTVAWGDAAYFITGKSPVESYGFWSSACPSLNLLFDVREKTLDYAAIRELVKQWREVMPYYYGDFYPLTRAGLNQADWMAWQFDRPEQGDGIVQVFRRSKSIYEGARLKLRGLDAKANYRIKQMDRENEIEVSGDELLNRGLRAQLETCPSAAVFRYQRAP